MGKVDCEKGERGGTGKCVCVEGGGRGMRYLYTKCNIYN